MPVVESLTHEDWKTVGQSAPFGRLDPGSAQALIGETAAQAKSDAKVSMRADVESVVVADTPVRLAALDAASTDVRDAGKVAELVTAAVSDGQEPSVTVRLAEVPADPTPQG